MATATHAAATPARTDPQDAPRPLPSAAATAASTGQVPSAHGTPAASPDDPRERLREMVKAAGWDRAVLLEIRDAALGGGRGIAEEGDEPLPDVDIREICRAVDILTDAGRTGAQVITRIKGYRDAGGDWRHEFWCAEMAAGAERWDELRRRQAATPPPPATISDADRMTVVSLAKMAALSDAALTNTLRGIQEHPALPDMEAEAALQATLQNFPAAQLPAALNYLRTLGAAELRHLRELAEHATA